MSSHLEVGYQSFRVRPIADSSGLQPRKWYICRRIVFSFCFEDSEESAVVVTVLFEHVLNELDGHIFECFLQRDPSTGETSATKISHIAFNGGIKNSWMESIS